jgi:L-lactate dehydrogenase
VGAAAASAITLQGVATDLLLVDADRRRAEAEAADISHASSRRWRAGGDRRASALPVAAITAGTAQRPGRAASTCWRATLRSGEVTASGVAAALSAVAIVATNPVDG